MAEAMRAPDSALVPSDLVLSPNALEALRMSELRKHAVIIGVARADIAKAVDSDRPKQMLIEMVLEQTAALGQALLRVVAELRDLRQSALEERAQAEGVSERELEEAIDDDEDPTGAIIKLILAQPTEQIADRNTVGPPSDAGVPVCPFCVNRSLSSRAIEAVPGGSRTRQRRELKSERKTPKWGRWWRQFGYNGPKYCQRCSEVLRDHIMRQKPNSARCTRDQPCDDCLKVLMHFSVSGEALWDKFDERAQHNRLKRARNSSDSAASGGGPGVAGMSVDGGAPAQRPAQLAKFGRASASVPGELYSSSPRSAAPACNFGRLAAASPPQRSNEFAALLASLHNQPFDATQAGIAARSARPSAGEASPRTAAAAVAAASLPHMPTQVHPQSVRLANRPLSDPGEGGTATEPVAAAPIRSATPPLQLLQPAHRPNLTSPQDMRSSAFDRLGSAAVVGEAAAMAMAAAAAQLQAQHQEMFGTDPATAQQGAL